LLKEHSDIFIDHIGDALDAKLGKQAQACSAKFPNYRWLGGLPHATTLRHIHRAHVLVHASRIEGGAHVVLEAVCSGTPVIASNIDGNIGMLGANYAGYFDVNDPRALANLLLRCREDQSHSSGFYDQLIAQCAARAPVFSPEAEQTNLINIVHELLQNLPQDPQPSNENVPPHAST
jgi:glycosyltransferase involved in cell wall biosynthesis